MSASLAPQKVRLHFHSLQHPRLTTALSTRPSTETVLLYLSWHPRLVAYRHSSLRRRRVEDPCRAARPVPLQVT